jgi:hypothetical protein
VWNVSTTGSWAHATDVITPNSDGNSLAIHVGILKDGDTSFTTTGFADHAVQVQSPIPRTPGAPEPSTLAIAGLGVLGFLTYGLRRRVK